MAVTLLIAFVIPPDRAVKATSTPRAITARTTPYSAIVWPSSTANRARKYATQSLNDIRNSPPFSCSSARRRHTPAFDELSRLVLLEGQSTSVLAVKRGTPGIPFV